MSIKTWQERMGVDKWQNVAMQSEINELRAELTASEQSWNRFHHLMKKYGWHPGRTDDDLIEILDARCAELKQANSDLAAASIENIQYGVDWGTNGDRTCVSIVKKHPDGHLEVVAAEYEPIKGKS